MKISPHSYVTGVKLINFKNKKVNNELGVTGAAKTYSLTLSYQIIHDFRKDHTLLTQSRLTFFTFTQSV